MITQSKLMNYVSYNPDTGVVTRLISDRRIKSGDVVTTTNGKGYIRTSVMGVRLLAHRIAFLYMTGDIPDQVDHINHIRHDNRWCNLRASNNQENQMNASMKSNNTSGFTGVSWDKRYSKWIAAISTNGKRINLGRFTNKEDAISARKAANIEFGFHKNHGVSY